MPDVPFGISGFFYITEKPKISASTEIFGSFLFFEIDCDRLTVEQLFGLINGFTG